MVRSRYIDLNQEMATLNSEDTCPHCRVKSPRLYEVYNSEQPLHRTDGKDPAIWAAFACSNCGSLVVAALAGFGSAVYYRLPYKVFPSTPKAHEDIPETARVFLQQAMDTLHAPDAAAVMAGSAVDAMLKALSLENGSLYSRIDDALKLGLITKNMADWAHSVRLGSNRPRHADTERPHTTAEEAEQSVEFAEALAQFLFVLSARVERGLAVAN